MPTALIIGASRGIGLEFTCQYLAGGSYGMLYRVSKAAVNMVGKLAHTDLSPLGVRVITLHPGWVRTDMGGPNADVEVADSVAGMRRVVAEPLACPSGGFFDYRGQPLAW